VTWELRPDDCQGLNGPRIARPQLSRRQATAFAASVVQRDSLQESCKTVAADLTDDMTGEAYMTPVGPVDRLGLGVEVDVVALDVVGTEDLELLGLVPNLDDHRYLPGW
jgi:hypothetical protein